ncbi:GEVED domain-containing protein [Psychroserpens sp. SPM9]|uniref:GEVED domain-containing protein n=1 Tax=Psychroserpens sp. SPM9 TaxID=2975598 RepID=UPI0021A3FA17|nr:GEVED domain-containing protein [Psychroserpens sp. SPM9]MDG5491714.1 GEVED domain-containing protein [Psychroserpens sp. SPM9]
MKKNTLIFLLTLAFTLQGYAQVCSSFSSTTTDTTTFIDEVSTSGAVTNISNLGTGLNAADDRYQDFYDTNAVTSFADGAFGLTVAIEGGTVGCAIWVDWNNDDTFDVATEGVFNTTSYSNGPFEASITVPTGTANGDYRMRIMIDWNDSNPDDEPCSFQFASGRGEVEDYKVIVGDPVTDTLDFYNLQFPTGANSSPLGDTYLVYAQAYEAGLTDVTAGQSPGISAWIGYSDTDTDPSLEVGWTWIPADFNVEVGNNDEYFTNLADGLAEGTYYYASRFSLNGGPLTYGGAGGAWNNDSGVLTITPPTPPANDECSDAIGLTVNADFSCDVVTSATVVGATASPQPDDATGTPDNDVWFTFVATGTNHRISLLNITAVIGTSVDMGMSVFDDAAGCNMTATNEVGESDPNILNLTGLTGGNTYYVRVYGWGSTNTAQTDFDICIGTPPPAPGNDLCENATVIACGDTLIDQTTISATGGSGTSCNGSIGDDVWYQFTGNDNDVTITVDASVEEAQIGVFESTDGTCGGFTLGSCIASVDDLGGNPTSVTFAAAAGNIYYIQVGHWVNGSPGLVFEISATCTPFPTCPDPTDLTASNITLTSADLGWTQLGGISNWDIEWGIEGFTPTGTPNVDDTGDNPYNLSALTAETSYDYYVRADCGMDNTTDVSAWVGPFTFFTGHCVPSGTSESTYIDNFSTTGGAVNISNLGSGFTTGNYEDNFDTATVSGASNDVIDFTVDIVSGTVGCAVWVDWNNDLTFDTSEVSFSTTGYSNGPFTGSITIPDATSDGDYRMRVMIDFNDSNPGNDAPCSFGSGRGEVEDYKLTVDNSLSVNDFETLGFTYFPNPVKNTLTLNAQNAIDNLTVVNMLGQQVLVMAPNSMDSVIDMSQLQTGTYFVKVTINNATNTIRIIKQ